MYSLTYDIAEEDENGENITFENEKKVAKGIVRCEIKKLLNMRCINNACSVNQ